MTFKGAWFCLVALCLSGAVAEEDAAGTKDPRLLPIFNIVTFPNDVCSSDSSRNGTCYMSEECSNKGGTSSGSCAEGFGVCCVFSLSCGESSSENNTYLVQSATTSITSPCEYTICKANSNICRIRYDFTTHVLAAPTTGTVVAFASSATAGAASAIGHCTTDSFTVTGSGGSSPVICGTNTGYHMIVDASETCSTALFVIGSSTSTTRSWDIYVTQFECGDTGRAGPPGCLQYHTGTTGYVQSFNFPSSNTVTATATHLASQYYTACIRRESSYCYICYTPVAASSEGISDQSTFGIGGSPTINIAQSATQTNCDTDYIYIPGGAATPGSIGTTAVNKFCGRRFNIITSNAAHASVCSSIAPFTVTVNFDDTEENTGASINIGTTNELSGPPGGIVGFRLVYTQGAC